MLTYLYYNSTNEVCATCRPAAMVDYSFVGSGLPSSPSAGWTIVWQPKTAKLARHFGSGRLSAGTVYRASPGTAPDGSPAVEFLAIGNQPNDIAQYKWYIGPNKQTIGTDVARMSAEGYFELGYEFNPQGSGKWPIGFWIGGTTVPPALPGGHPSLQKGVTVRVHHGVSGNAKAYPGIYSYHLNRESYATGWWGRGPDVTNTNGQRVEMPTGKWVKFVLEVHLNTPGQADGWAQLDMIVDDAVVATARLTNAIYRDTGAWKIGGPNITDMWGGSPLDSPFVMPPKTQNSWWRNWKIEVPAE